MRTQRFYIEGMTCVACSSSIERALGRKPYIAKIEVNLVDKVAVVVYDEKQSNLEQIFALIKKLGYTPYKETHKTSIKEIPTKVKLSISIIATLIVLYLSMVGMFIPLPNILQDTHLNVTLQIVLTLTVMLLHWQFYYRGFYSLIAKSPNMDTLIAISTTAALVYSFYLLSKHLHGLYFESIVVILTLVGVGKAIEDRAKRGASDSITLLLEKQDKEVLVVRGGVEQKLSYKEVQVGDLLRILPGGFVGVDGILEEGEGFLDESMLTGEALPIYKKRGDKIIAGSLNTTTSFVMRATTTTHSSTLQAMVSLIEEATRFKTKMTRLADKVAAIFVPSVIGIALLAGIYWAFMKDFTMGFEVFIAVLVISCPCALGLATPMAVMIGSSLANKKGMFFRNAEAMESCRYVSSVVFDKTGTLTQAKLKVKQIIATPSHTQEEILQIAASVEQGSEHLIAKAVLQRARELEIPLLETKEFKSIAGYGMSARIAENVYYVGNKDLFKYDLPPLQDSGIIVGIGSENECLGVILLQDIIKEGALETIEDLQQQHIKSYIVSGDNEANVKQVADTLHIVHFVANAKPKDKFDFIEDLKQKGEVVMMVGDGINDVAAMQASNISCSFTQASDISYESAMIIICNDSLKNTYYAIMLGRAIVKNIQQNLFWAFCYNIVSIPIACGVLYSYGILLNPMLSALAMSLSSLSVVANAMRLKRVKF